ncbi:hypothetical protein SLH46_05520 [Draconibacterium sp. IB214405]|uniref:hypothetical protein n=1 Tax=Draconibacterium sp. IB214405 TaxID=3097352 RepID=UPI002A148611|nr:hypothetical protein [Draconibacterium sp. IB214405]MDX8338630.1 hypothetical protein [Draconibacterium sp. IB214405]
MGRFWHSLYLFSLVAITILVLVFLVVYGADYYLTDIGERHFHEQDALLRPTGLIGHGLGIIGATLMVVGVFGYMARKRFRFLWRLGVLKHWLEFHIFLCTLGPIMVLFHTSFKFGGIVAVSFWSMVAVVISGVIGRVIYLQIPRTIEGREMSLNELNKMEAELWAQISNGNEALSAGLQKVNVALKTQSYREEGNYVKRLANRLCFERSLIAELRKELKEKGFKGKNYRKAIKILKSKIIMNRRIAWLSTMQQLMRYWHVAHLPFALIMLVIMLVHIVVALLFGYNWIF